MSTRRPLAPDGAGGLSQIVSPDTIDDSILSVPFMPRVKTGSALYHFPPTSTVGSGNIGRGLNSLAATAFFVDRSCTVDRMGMRNLSAATAGGKVRMGIYADDGTGQPGALLIDAGTIPVDVASAYQELTISLALTRGLYWEAAVQQVAVCPMNNYTAPPVGNLRAASGFGLTNLIGFNYGGFLHNASVTGALPGTFVPTTTDLCPNGVLPLILTRVT